VRVVQFASQWRWQRFAPTSGWHVSTERIFTSTNKSNAPMTGFLEKIGWRFSGELEGIDDGDPEMVYYQDATPDH